MKLWIQLFLIIAVPILTSGWIKAQSTFAIPFNLNLSGVSFSLDSAGTFIMSGPLNESAPDNVTLPTGPQFDWYPSLDAIRIGNFDTSINTNALPEDSIVIGDNAQTSGVGSIAIGPSAITQWGDSGAVAIGANAAAEGGNAIAVGGTAYGSGSVAIGGSVEWFEGTTIGFLTGTTGYGATALGEGSFSAGNGSLAAGSNCITTCYYSTAIGQSVTTNSAYSIALGCSNAPALSENGNQPDEYNWIATDPLLELGNGGGSTPNSNALVIYKNGDAHFQGVITASPSPEIPMYSGN